MARFQPGPALQEVVASATVAQRAEAAERALAVARRTVDTDTGSYENESLYVDVNGAEVTFGTDDFAGHVIEWGSINHTPQAPLRTGAAAVGRFDPL